MTTKYMLLNNIQPMGRFGISVNEFIKATREEYHCDVMVSKTGPTYYNLFIISNTKEDLERLCAAENLDGVVVEYTGVYDQVEENLM